jgi:hypothetical protein
LEKRVTKYKKKVGNEKEESWHTTNRYSTRKKGASKRPMVVINVEDDSDSDADCPDYGKLFSTDKSG